MFIGREHELAQLEKITHTSSASLVVCKGRRRIGKSTLIESFGKSFKNFIEFQGLAPRDGLNNQSQLVNFSEQCALYFKLPGLTFKNWTEAFDFLAKQTQSGKWLIFLDEISWLAAYDADFVGKLKIAWDVKFKKNSKLVLVLCGSVSSWIDKNIINNADFMGRTSLVLHLKELSLKECQQFWTIGQQKRISAFEKAKLLSVTGGVPRYLEEINYQQSAEENIHQLCFSPHGLLFTEFDKIFNDIFDKRAAKYKQIVKHLVQSKSSFLQICQALKTDPNGVISEYLNDLESSGFITRDYIYKFDGERSKLSRYRIQDNYLRFYLKYIEPNKDKIEKKLYHNIDLVSLPHWNIIMGLQFENLILNNMHLLFDKLSITPASVVSAAPYFQEKNSKNKGACQIDLLIQTRTKTLYLIETKFRKKIDTTTIKEVQKKIDILKRPKYFSVRPILIYEGELSEDVVNEQFFDSLISFEALIA